MGQKQRRIQGHRAMRGNIHQGTQQNSAWLERGKVTANMHAKRQTH